MTKVCHCGEKSVPGLIPSVALCQYHYNVFMFGKTWADSVEENREVQSKEETPQETPCNAD